MFHSPGGEHFFPVVQAWPWQAVCWVAVFIYWRLHLDRNGSLHSLLFTVRRAICSQCFPPIHHLGCRWAQLDAGPGQPEEDSAVHKMAMNIGRRPSIEDGTDITVEVHILHSFAASDFRGRQLRVVVGGFIRRATFCTHAA